MPDAQREHRVQLEPQRRLIASSTDAPRSRRPLAVAGVVVVVVLAIVAGLVWFLMGNSDESRDTSGFAPPATTQASFCDGVAGFQADFASVDPGADPTAYIDQVRTAADRLRSTGVPPGIPDEARASLTAYLRALTALPDSATARDVSRLRSGGTATERQQRKALDSYLATECPTAG